MQRVVHSAGINSSAPVVVACRCVSTGVFDHPKTSFSRKHTFNTLPIHDANNFGGRVAQLREIGPVNIKKKGRAYKKDKELSQFDVDVWCAQQTLRKRWKGRDWDVVEMPFQLAPKELQRVIPELYTDVPQPVDAKGNDYQNVRSKVFDVEELQQELFGGTPFPHLRKVNASAQTLDKFL